MRVFLIGMPGSGKSTLGESLADTLELPFFDLDEEIEEREEKTINEIFEESGENYFRNLETKFLRDLIYENEKVVIATGGGAPCFFGNMDYMNENGITVFLNPPIKELVTRLNQMGKGNRPLLKDIEDDKLLNELESKLAERIEFYQEAELTFDNSAYTAEDITKGIKKVMEDPAKNFDIWS